MKHGCKEKKGYTWHGGECLKEDGGYCGANQNKFATEARCMQMCGTSEARKKYQDSHRKKEKRKLMNYKRIHG
jgi:hypothetical protein